MSNMKLPALALSSLLVSACMPKPDMYVWGQYESLLIRMYTGEQLDEEELSRQIAGLESDIQNAEKWNRKTPPGVYAHLGYLYASAGNQVASKQAFEEEKQNFPESAQFIDGMMDRAFKDSQS